jgi:hypothetical protein
LDARKTVKTMEELSARRRHNAAALRKRGADLLRRVYEVDPLICPRCASTMRVVGSITDPVQVERI